MNSVSHYKVIGLMSGTSLDGLDLAFCEFTFDGKWSFKLVEAETIRYSAAMTDMLQSIGMKSAAELAEAHLQYGAFLGKSVKQFEQNKKVSSDFVSSHGHTIFHQPKKGYTFQLGSGASLAAESGRNVVCDFRTTDVALGGQGAPLVPVGDRLLFSEFEYCLNLGGIANISFEKNGKRIAFDICACNIVLNVLAEKKGMSFDEDGKMARAGFVNEQLLNELDALAYYHHPFPKSLGREDIDREIFPLLEKANLSVEDAAATFCRHIANQISRIVEGSSNKMLVTGGGAYHSLLVEQIKHSCDVQVIVPERKIIEFKEAIIFAFLGVLRMRNEVNALSSVTGAKKDSSGGAIYRN